MHVKVVSVRYIIANNSQDVPGGAQFHIHVRGHHDDDLVVWAGSGETRRLEAGNYDIGLPYEIGLVHGTKWLDNTVLTGNVDRGVDLGLMLAQPTVHATLDGKDVGDKAQITFHPAGQGAPLGAVPGGTKIWIRTGSYDLLATMPGAEGWLRAASIQGENILTTAMKPLKTEELKAGAPPPKACTIEVYGVNFDFDKAVLQPDAEPVLKAVLNLFTGTPSFGAEVGGHTDNIGKPDYDMRLSDARAAAVKTWLVEHGVAAMRVTSRGYGDTRPLVENDTDEHRFQNRRVELRRPNCQ